MFTRARACHLDSQSSRQLGLDTNKVQQLISKTASSCQPPIAKGSNSFFLNIWDGLSLSPMLAGVCPESGHFPHTLFALPAGHPHDPPEEYRSSSILSLPALGRPTRRNPNSRPRFPAAGTGLSRALSGRSPRRVRARADLPAHPPHPTIQGSERRPPPS